MTGMADEKSTTGGFHFGSVGGEVKITAGNDIIAGDKNTTTTIQKGFAAEVDKQQFQLQIDQLRETLRQMKAQIEAHPKLSVDEKEEATGELLQLSNALKEVKESTQSTPVGISAPPEVGSAVESTLKRAGGILEQLQTIAKKSAGIAEIVGQYIGKYGPLVASARHLFGLP